MPKAETNLRPAKKRPKNKYTTQVGHWSYYKKLYFEQNKTCGLSGAAMNETDSIYYKDNLLALESAVLDAFGELTGWTLVSILEPNIPETVIEEYDHYEAWQ